MARPVPERRPITFVVPGQRTSGATRGAGAAATPPEGLRQGRVKESVRVGAHRGGGGSEVRVDAMPGEDVVVLHIANGPALMLHPETARDLLQAQAQPPREDKTRGTRADDALTCAVPARLGWRHGEGAATRAGRGLIGDVLLAGLDVVTDLFQEKAADLVASAIVGKVDAQVVPGVHRLDQARIGELTKKAEAGLSAGPDPLLVFVHGTFSEHAAARSPSSGRSIPQRVRALFDRYGRPRLRARASDARREPDRQRADARPGAGRRRAPAPRDALARRPGRRGAGARLRRPRRGGQGSVGEGPGRDACARSSRTSSRVVRQNASCRSSASCASPVRRAARCSPRSGSTPTSRSSSGRCELAGIPVLPELVDFLGEVAQRRADPDELPGLAAQIPDSPLVRWLQRGGRGHRRRPARRRRRHRGRLGHVVAEDAARRRVLLDRQRPRRADALDVRRHAARRAAPTLRARPGRQGLALQLLRATSARRRDRRRAARRRRPPTSGRSVRSRGPGEDPTGVRAERGPRQRRPPRPDPPGGLRRCRASSAAT